MGEIKKILQVEDEEGIATLVVTILAPKGIDVDLATNFEEATAALGSQNGYAGLQAYDAMLLDMNFPGGNGADIARMAREQGYQGRIVMFSGADLPEAKEQTQDLPNIGYLNKPNQPDRIVLALQGWEMD